VAEDLHDGVDWGVLNFAEAPYKKFTKRLKAGELGGQTSFYQQEGRLSLHQL
jgi:hypothetical protein